MKARFSISGAVLAVLLLVSTSSAAEKPGATSSGLRLSKSLGEGSVTTTMSINNINLWVTKHGAFPPDWSGCGCASSEYPIGGPGMMFQEGYLYGAKVTDDSSTAGAWPRVRVNGATHAHGLKAGKVLYNEAGEVTGPADFTDAQVWRVRRDYKTADLTRDAATFEAIPAEDVTDAMIQETYDGYEYDWANWPADQGAPFDDVDGDGVYDPAVDIAGYPGADMTVWTVANDLPRADGTQVSTDSYGSPSTGVELQFTIWAYAFAADNPLGNIIFKRFRMIYTGVPGASETCKLDTVYFVNWSDPDLGDYSDDYVGCDTLLSLGYVYNANTLDAISYGDYGLPVAAGGYDFLQGPITAAGDTLGMSSFTFFGAGSGIEDPDQYVYNGSLQYFNLMEGFLPDPAYPAQEPFTDYITGEATKFVHSGDPVTGEGWIDGLSLPPGDRRLVMSTGPFEMALGDTQDIVVALIGAMGGDNLSSVTVLKYYDLFAQYAYDNNFVLPSAPTMPKVEMFGGDGYISLNWGTDNTALAATEEPVYSGFAFEGYNVYQLPSAAATPSEGIKIITYDLPNGITTILEKTVDPETGQVLDLPAQTGKDVELKRYIVIERDRLRNRPISNDIAYFFGVSAYSFLPGAEALGSPFKSLESGMTVISVFPQEPEPGATYSDEATDMISTVHGAGTSTAYVEVQVLDPSALDDADWEVYYSYYTDSTGAHMDSVTAADTLDDGSPSYSWGWNLEKNSTLAIKNQDHPDKTYTPGGEAPDAPILDGIQVMVFNPPETALADWDYQGTRWISGTDWGGAQLFGGADLGENFWGPMTVTGSDYVPVELVFQDQADVDANGYAAEGAVYTRPGYAYAGIGEMPFTAWEIDAAGEHVRQLNVSFVEWDDDTTPHNEHNMLWDMGWNGTEFTADGALNYTFIHASDYDGGVSYDDANNALEADVLYAFWPGARGTHPWLEAEFTLQLYPAVAAGTSDTFTWSTTATTSDELAADDIENINVFPNPYYGYQVLERSRAAKWMRFNHLPTDREVTIRVFNLGGIMVRTIIKPETDGTQYAEWNLLNQAGYPVASGIYIAFIEVDGVDKTKILKLAIVQEVQILDVY